MIILELPQRAAASALIFRLFALEVNGIRVAYDAQNFSAGQKYVWMSIFPRYDAWMFSSMSLR